MASETRDRLIRGLSAGALGWAVLFFPGCVVRPSARGPACVVRGIIEADNAADIDGVLAHYTDDVVWLSSAGRVISGKTAVRARYEQMYGEYSPELSATIDESEVGESLALVRGTTSGQLVPRKGGEAVAVRDRFLCVLRHERSGWRASHLMWVPIE